MVSGTSQKPVQNLRKKKNASCLPPTMLTKLLENCSASVAPRRLQVLLMLPADCQLISKTLCRSLFPEIMELITLQLGKTISLHCTTLMSMSL